MFEFLASRLLQATQGFRSEIHRWMRPSRRRVLGYALDRFRSRDQAVDGPGSQYGDL